MFLEDLIGDYGMRKLWGVYFSRVSTGKYNIIKTNYFCWRSGDLRYWESSEGLRSLVSPILVALRIPAGGRRSGLTSVQKEKLSVVIKKIDEGDRWKAWKERKN